MKRTLTQKGGISEMWNKYSIELRTLLEDELFELFSFEYDFYTDDKVIKAKFEQKFKDHYYYDEIGAETVARWKHQLKSRLNMIAPYYRKLYETELRIQGIDFMLNKDLVEEFERIVEGTKQADSTVTSDGSTLTKGSTTSKVSNLENGVASVKLANDYLTGMSNDTVNSDTSSNSNVLNKNKEQDTMREKTIHTSKGNIGVVSASELLKKWRSIIINIDEMVIEECKDLFMMIY